MTTKDLLSPPKTDDNESRRWESIQFRFRNLDQKVRVSKTSKPKSEPVVPEILNELLTGLKEYISKVGAEVYNVINIQNAKKLQIKLGLKKAEINVFHGKRGFSVVSVPKGETDGEFNEMMRQLIICYINEN